MKRKKKLSKELQLVVALALLLGLCSLGWMTEDRPMLTAGAAFRQGLRDAMLPVVDLDMRVNYCSQEEDLVLGIGADEAGAYVVPLRGPKAVQLIWWHEAGVRAFPAVDGVRYVFFNGYSHQNRSLFDCPIGAVKTSGKRAELRLVLEPAPRRMDWRDSPSETYIGGSWVLPGRALSEDWTLFFMDEETLNLTSGKRFEECPSAYSYCEWLWTFADDELGTYELTRFGHFELTLFDENGDAEKTVVLQP